MRSKLGQHFLRDERALRQIADSLGIGSNDVIVEIGPGHGELTKYLVDAKPKKIVAIEKDKGLVSTIRNNLKKSFLQTNSSFNDREYLKIFEKIEKLEIIEGDALKVLPTLTNQLKAADYKLTGNIPYYITGYLLRIISQLEKKPNLIVLIIQKEVAERICAKPPKMNLLAASVQFWAKPEILGFVDKKLFSPVPEVDGATIKLVPRTIKKGIKEQCYQLIKIAFKQPRKTILNNLSAGSKISKEKIIEKLIEQGIKPNTRPQNLTIQDLTALSDVFHDKK